MKTINELTLYDLMAEDLEVWVKVCKNYGFNLIISDDKNEVIIDDEHIDPAAAESFADFCKQYLECYNRVKK